MIVCTKITARLGAPFHIVTATERTWAPVVTLCGRRTAWPFCIAWRPDVPTCRICVRARFSRFPTTVP